MRPRPYPALAALALAGCGGIQSALDPGGPVAGRTYAFTLVMFAGAAVIFVLVGAIAAWAWATTPEGRRLRPLHLIVGGGLVFPILVLSVLVILTAVTSRAITAPGGPETLRVEVVGLRWWWKVRYPGDGPGDAVETANEIHIPVGRPVEFVVGSPDVIHSFWVPGLGGKIDMIPGHTNRILLQADRPGVYRGQCAEYCGAQHANMAFLVVAVPPDEFAVWLARQRRPAREPDRPQLARGRELFLASGCGACHAVRGTAAQGDLGPDLTLVGGRRTIAAGTLPANVGTLAGWIADAQDIKPGNLMPSFNQFEGAELRAIAAYLGSLE